MKVYCIECGKYKGERSSKNYARDCKTRCRSCSKVGKRNPFYSETAWRKLTRKCPSCNTILTYTDTGNCQKAEKRKSVCARCAQAGENHPNFGKELPNKVKRKIRLSNINTWKKKGMCYPNYNIEACKAIDEYGAKHDYNFQHAKNGGEFYIEKLGYWVDGYDEENNVVIEYDEPYHYTVTGNLRKKDKIRQQEIEEYLDCKFIRIKQ